MAKSKRIRQSEIVKVREVFVAIFPNTFCKAKTLKRPLKVGIYQDLANALPGIPRKLLKATLTDYVNGCKYHQVMIAGADRYDLDGNPCGTIDAEHAAHHARINADLIKKQVIEKQKRKLEKKLSKSQPRKVAA